MRNPLYAPVWPQMRDGTWDTLVSVPLVYQDRALGCLNVFYPRVPEPSLGEIDFLTAIAGQAAVAAKNAELFSDAQGKAALEERQRLARDLHDSVSQTLFSASLVAEVLPLLWARDIGEGKRRLEEIRQLTRGALAEMRMLLLELRPAALTEIALGDLLRELAEATTGRTRLPIAVSVSGSSRELPSDVQVALYRIAQEAVNNAVKHAKANVVTITLRYQREHVLVSVNDDGLGFVEGRAGGEHFGLGIMRERAEAIGASIEVVSSPAHGARIAIDWPDYRNRTSHG
jgi:signal transduction histidine kinase